MKDLFKINKIAMYILAGIIVIGFFVLMYILMFVHIPIENVNTANLAIGALIGSFTNIIGYFFGSSSGSAEKTQLLNKKEEIKEITPVQ
jgi:ABC-type Na+ efflux pump permease subunit